MDCERCLNLISARLDREIGAEDLAELERHLETCPDCRAAGEAFSLQHRELRGAFLERRAAAAETATATAARVNTAAAADRTRPAPARPPARGNQAWMWVAAAAVAAALVVAVLLPWQRWRSVNPPNPGPSPSPSGQPGPNLFSQLGALTPRPQPPAKPAEKLAVGDTVKTGRAERRRLVLPDQSVLYVDRNTSVRLEADRTVRLDAGSVYIEAESEPQPLPGGEGTFFVSTPTRQVTATGTRFAVHADGDGTDVLVTQGAVQVSGVGEPVRAGQRLGAKDNRPAPAPRASALLDWTRDLMAAAESSLVPASAYGGGALIAVDANGQEAKLSLREFKVDVHIEDGFARTTIDQTYFNHHPWRLEGTFYFPLPPDASLSRLAMYVDDGKGTAKLMEGGMAERQHARQVYQRIVNNQRDPALLEWVDGSTFKMRVFPLEGRQKKRIILSYTQKLPTLYGRTQYRFPAGHNLQLVRDWEFRAVVKNGRDTLAVSPSHPDMKVEKERRWWAGRDELVLSTKARNTKIDRDVVLDLNRTELAGGGEKDEARFVRVQHDGADYLALRYHPALEGRAERQRRDWVFLVETSADRDPLVARTEIEVLRNLLANAGHDDTFQVLTAGTRVRRFSPEARKVTPENVAAAVAFLDRSHLVGALDLGTAFDEAARAARAVPAPHIVHLGSGITAIGTRQDQLGKRLPADIPYIGVGVGKRWGRSLMKECADRSGGYFTQINPDETVSWRAFDLLATLDTPRLLDVKVEVVGAGEGSPRFLGDAASVAQGEEVFAVARLDGTDLPRALVVSGRLDGRTFRRELPVAGVADGGGYLPRTWAKLEIDRLLTEDARANKDAIIKLSNAMYVMTPYTSLLVLENDDMYREFNVDRGRKDHWAMYPAAPTDDLGYEPDPTMPVDVRNAPKTPKPAANTVLQSLLVRGSPQFLHGRDRGRENNEAQRADEFFAYFAVPEPKAGLPADSVERLSDLDLDGGAVLGRPPMSEAASLAADYAPHPVGGTLAMPEGRGSLRHLPTESPPALAFSPDGSRVVSTGRRLSERQSGRAGREWALHGISDITNASGEYDLKRLKAEDAYAGQALGLTPRYYSPRGLVDGEFLLADEPAIDFADPARPALGGEVAGRTDARARMGPGAPAGRGPASVDNLLYERLAYTNDQRLFTDLTAYAPGLNTSWADVQAVLEEEAAPELRSAPGSIQPEARKLIDGARQAKWRSLTLKNGDGPALVIRFDGTGRYAYERTLSLGLREIVVCDGTTLLHLYPEIGLGARRTVSRFHRAGLSALVPGFVPPAEDLARGADLVVVGERTVAVVPHKLGRPEDQPKKTYQVHLVFAEDGRLAERRLVEMPDNKVRLRYVYDGQGEVRLFVDADDKEKAKVSRKIEAADAPNLTPETAGLVVLPLPLRTRDHVMRSLGLDPGSNLRAPVNVAHEYLDEESALRLLAEAWAARNADEARIVFRDCFAEHGDQRIGLYVLLSASGLDPTTEPAFEYHLTGKTEPLARYLAYQHSDAYRWAQERLPLDAQTKVTAPDTFLRRLAAFRDLSLRWRRQPWLGVGPLVRPGDAERTLAFVKANPRSPAAWALLLAMQDYGHHSPARWKALASAWDTLAGPEGNFHARYEQAWCQFQAGDEAGARKRFLDLYAAALKDETLLPLDNRFRSALRSDDPEKDEWAKLMRRTAADLVEKKRRGATALLAWQAHQLGDPLLADNLVGTGLAGDLTDKERRAAYLSAVGYFSRVGEYGRAEELVERLLKQDPKDPGLWRLASHLADQRGKTERAVACLETALDLEYADLPEVIALQPWRADYRRLLEHYRGRAEALAATGAPVPADLAARTVRAADRWRAHDPEAADASRLAGATLKLLGTRDLAWEYLTTPSAGRDGEERSLSGLATELRRGGDYDLAENAFALASAAEPSDGMVAWERAENLRQAGKPEEARRLLEAVLRDKDVPATVKARIEWRLKAQ
jgi:ferric-dicitrate binding protein FerR (iron transport regulator)